MKKCSMCLIEKNYSEFRKDKTKKDWYYSSCSDCYRLRNWIRKIWTFVSPRKTHWYSWTRIYKTWKSIKERCYSKNTKSYLNYWWRWIICEWETFEDFFRDMWSSYRDDLEIDRIDVNWNYSKDNCRWVDIITQARDKRNVEKFLYKWEILTIPEISEKFWIKSETFRKRIIIWYSIEEAIESKMHQFSWRKKSILSQKQSWDQ